MPFGVSDNLAFRVQRKTQSAQGYALIDFHMVADHASLTDHDASTVINKKALTNLGTRMDIDSRFSMHPLAQHSW